MSPAYILPLCQGAGVQRQVGGELCAPPVWSLGACSCSLGRPTMYNCIGVFRNMRLCCNCHHVINNITLPASLATSNDRHYNDKQPAANLAVSPPPPHPPDTHTHFLLLFLVNHQFSFSVFQRRIQAMEMRCYCKILHISYKDHVTNEEVHAKIQQAIGPHEDLLTIVKKRKLQWYGRVPRSSGLAKTILQGTVKGRRRQGRQRKRWEENIKEWTGLEFGKSQRAVENKENGENWLQNHLWCPNDPRG